MQCPGCGLYHPARYEQCVSCGRSFTNQGSEPEARTDAYLADEESESRNAPQAYYDDNNDDEYNQPADNQEPTHARPNSGRQKNKKEKKPLPLGMIVVAIGILLASAGGTYFFLSRPPESERLLSEGQKQLANGQYAFAQKTLEQAMAIKPNDAKILLSLARAYVGTDQVERAWSCISQAQQSGSGLMTDPQLTSDLAKYYVQRNQYARASELLRPLAQQNISNKKRELADLDALWGDECFNKGETEQALKCWEEIKTLGEGSRVNEVDTRLATIYQKMANEHLAKDDIESALKCLNNLNTIAPSPQSYEKCADLYAKQGKLDLAVDQMRKAIKQGNGSKELNRKIAGFLSRRGKELLEQGDAETGYAYLQQAQGYDSSVKAPTVALRNVNINVENFSGTVRTYGEVWNPGPSQVAYLTVRAELFDSNSSQVVWSKEQRVVDEFVVPLQARESKQFDISGPLAVGQPGLEMRVYLDGRLYKSYQIGGKEGTGSAGNTGQPGFTPQPPAPAQPVVPVQLQPAFPPPGSQPQAPAPGTSPEERTLRDLE